MYCITPNPIPRLILPIQYLRGVAALMVVWHHARTQIPGMNAYIPGNFGTSGVDLFFVISGFIMVVTTTGSSMRPWQFLQRRIIRVVPMYWLLTLLMVALAVVMPDLFKTLKVSSITLLQSLFFIPHFSESFPSQVWPLLVPGWTLDFEMFFYAIFGASLFLPARSRLVTLTVFFFGLTIAGFWLGPFGSSVAQTYTNPMLLEFVAGALVGGWWMSGPVRVSFRLSLIFVFIGAALLVLRNTEPLRYFTQFVGATLLVIGALDSRFRAWRSGVFQALGDSSYSLYLTHIFTLGTIRVAWGKLVSNSPTPFTASLFMLVSLIICAVVGWLTYRWVENPLSRKLVKLEV